MNANYDAKDRLSIAAFATKLEGQTLRSAVGDLPKELNILNKGDLGQLIEEFYFEYKPNNKKEPDFPEAELELKSTPLKKLKRGSYSAKERLVLNIIDYVDEHKQTWRSSSFWKKNAHLLLIFYLHVAKLPVVDREIKLVGLWDYPPEDLLIIEQDWKKIWGKIDAGKAHEISEGDTLYLGACTKGEGGEPRLRDQPNSKQPAKQRAFSLKRNYVDVIAKKWLKQRELELTTEPVVKDLSELQETKSFEQIVINRFAPFIGKTELQLLQEFSIGSESKGKYAAISRRIMGVKKAKVEEFEKAGITMKTIRLNRRNTPKEDISFPYFKHKELALETDWEESELRDILDKKFLFVFFKEKADGTLVLRGAKFWNMPIQDLDGDAKRVWQKTIDLINAGKAEYLPKKSETITIHVRPHGADKTDKDETPQGKWVTKKCFWLNAPYIKKQVVEPMNIR